MRKSFTADFKAKVALQAIKDDRSIAEQYPERKSLTNMSKGLLSGNYGRIFLLRKSLALARNSLGLPSLMRVFIN